MRIKFEILLFIISFLLNHFLVNGQELTSYELALKYFNDKNYIIADSLFTIAINEHPEKNVYFNRALSRYHLKDMKGFCADIKITKELDDEEAGKIYYSQCVSVDSIKDVNSYKIIKKDLFQNYHEVEEYSYDNEILTNYYKQDSIIIFTYLKNIPIFPGGEAEMYKYIAINVEYPRQAVENGIQGEVIVSFLVLKNGSISNIEITNGVHPLLDISSLKVVKSMPRFEPANYNNIAVNYRMIIPINFKLE